MLTEKVLNHYVYHFVQLLVNLGKIDVYKLGLFLSFAFVILIWFLFEWSFSSAQ